MDTLTVATSTLENDLMKLARHGWRIEIIPTNSMMGYIYAEIKFYSPQCGKVAVNPTLEGERFAQGMMPGVPCVAGISMYQEGALARTIRRFCAMWIDPLG